MTATFWSLTQTYSLNFRLIYPTAHFPSKCNTSKTKLQANSSKTLEVVLNPFLFILPLTSPIHYNIFQESYAQNIFRLYRSSLLSTATTVIKAAITSCPDYCRRLLSTLATVALPLHCTCNISTSVIFRKYNRDLITVLHNVLQWLLAVLSMKVKGPPWSHSLISAPTQSIREYFSSRYHAKGKLLTKHLSLIEF